MPETLRILWMNWRDIRHPQAGGAEVYTHEVARRLAAKGHEVILATSRPPGLPETEEIDGYTVIRRGGRLTVYPAARKTYHALKHSGWRPDVVIDEINTIPFLTPLYAKEPITVLIHQLCKDCWSHHVGPLQPLAWLAERQLHRLYIHAARKARVKAVITVSESTRNDLTQLGYPPETIHLALNAIDWDQYRDCPALARDKNPNHVVYIGRIAPYKLLEELLQAWRIIEKENPEAKLTIAGRPDPAYLRKLKHLTRKLSLKHVDYRLNIPEQEKKHLLANAGLLVYTSKREGWGIALLEAAACKTPAIAYNVPGLRDAAKYLQGVILVPPHRPEHLAREALALMHNPEQARNLAEKSNINARKLTWNKTAETIEALLRGAKASHYVLSAAPTGVNT